MARPLRVEYPGAFYHVMNRGNAGEAIFTDDDEKTKFLNCLERCARRFSFRVHGYCLMTNHYHLLLETPEPNLSRSIQWLNVSYASWYNRRHRRSGHLFQGRFKALLVEADSYLTALSRYIHLNPVRAGLLQDPAAYVWSSCPDFLGSRPAPDWLETGRILSEFHSSRPEAMQCYRAFLDPEEATENPNSDSVAGFILGSSDFLDRIRREFLLDRPVCEEVPQLRQLRKIDPGIIVKAVCAEFGGTAEDIRRKGSKGCVPRLVAVGLARDFCGMAGKELGHYFGGITGAAVAMMGKKFEREIGKDPKFKKRSEHVKEECLRFKM